MVGVLTMFAVLILSFAVAGLWWWVAFWAALLVLLGAFEVLAVYRTGLTLSHQFTRLVQRRPLIGAILSAILGGAVGFLIYHLATGW